MIFYSNRQDKPGVINKGLKKLGFTLIELLMVISIISLLSSVVMASVKGAQAKARDARRVEDIKQLTIAIQLYIQDHGYAPRRSANSEPPEATDRNRFSSTDDYGVNWSPEFIQMMSPYMKKLPLDPSNGQTIPGNRNEYGQCSYVDPSCSKTYRYYYERFDTWRRECTGNQGEDINTEYCIKNAYYLSVTSYEAKNSVRINNSYFPLSAVFGGFYPKLD